MFTIMIFHGSEYIKYYSSIVPLVGDIYPQIDQWEQMSFKVVKRVLGTDSNCPNLITVNVEPTY